MVVHFPPAKAKGLNISTSNNPVNVHVSCLKTSVACEAQASRVPAPQQSQDIGNGDEPSDHCGCTPALQDLSPPVLFLSIERNETVLVGRGHLP